MTSVPPRDGAQRTLDVRTRLGEPRADVWVASASRSGVAHLVPLSLAWHGGHVILALEPASLTARNILESGRARLALGATRDVTMIDAVLEEVVQSADIAPELAAAYAQQAGWDPSTAGDGNVYLLLRPDRIQAWREVNELRGRTVMRAGEWLF